MSANSHANAPHYYVPAPSRHPAMASLGLFFVILGASQLVNDSAWGKYALLMGMVIWLTTLYQWFGDAIDESLHGQYGARID
ncbi:MAG: Cytochrome c oxidase subunit 3, partial [Pseudomonadota bacterium]